MKKLLILFCSLLLNGVFGDTDEVKVSVKEGDSVTLKIKPEDINGATDLVWWLKDKNIAKIDLEVKDKPPEYTDERFRDRLNLERQTGSLTITNIRSEHSGEYKLEIRGRGQSTHKTFRVSVSDKMNTVSVTEGYSLTLNGVTHGKIDDVKWKFNGADLTGHIDSTFKNCEVNNQTGNLNIRNIRRNQSGDYEVRINGGSFILLRTYRVNVNGEVKKSVMKGDDVILQTDLTHIQIDDVIEWRFKDTLIAYSNKTTHNVPYNDAEGRFTGRLHLEKTGALIINNFRSEDYGVYDVNITGSKIIHKKFIVTESSQRSNGEKTGPGSLVVLILMGMFLIH